MKDLFGGTFYKWLGITFIQLICFYALDYIFETNTNVSYFEAGFLAYVILWCADRDKNKE